MTATTAALSVADRWTCGYAAKDATVLATEGVICRMCLPTEERCECCGQEIDDSGHFRVAVDLDTTCADCGDKIRSK